MLRLIRTALDSPVVMTEDGEGSQYRLGQRYVASALPALLEGTAYHPDHIREAVTLLWELAKPEPNRSSDDSSVRTVLKRLSFMAALHRCSLQLWHVVAGHSSHFSLGCLTGDYTPFDIIRQLLEKDGEFTEWQDESTMSFGGFGLNHAAVGPIRRSALDYLESALSGDGIPAIQSVQIMEHLLHNYLNRMGRVSSPEEVAWQNEERERCLTALQQRFEQPSSLVLRARLYDAMRSATAINCPPWVQERAAAALGAIYLPDEVAVVDAVCTADHDLPTLTTEFSEHRWEQAITNVMAKGRSSLERLIDDPGNQAQFTLEQSKACLAVRVATGGFHRFMLSFVDRPDFLHAMAEQIVHDDKLDILTGQLSSVLNAIHTSDAAALRHRALAAIDAGATQVIHAAANNLRVFTAAEEADIALIRTYGQYPDTVAKLGAIYAITYMGRFTDLLPSLKSAVLSIRTEGDNRVAAELADAFGPYGVPLTTLTREEAAAVAAEVFLSQLGHNGCMRVGTDRLEDLLAAPGIAKVILTFGMQFHLPLHQYSLRKDFAIFPVGGRGETPLPIIFLDVDRVGLPILASKVNTKSEAKSRN